MPDNDFRRSLMKIATDIAEASSGKFRLARNEADDLRTPDKEAAHFLKMDERRYGRDIELYGLMELAVGEGGALLQFAEEIVLPLKQLAPGPYAVAVEALKSMGRTIFPAQADEWNALFEDAPSSGPAP